MSSIVSFLVLSPNWIVYVPWTFRDIVYPIVDPENNIGHFLFAW